MPCRNSLVRFTPVLACLLVTTSLSAQKARRPQAAPGSGSLQNQIDALKQGQQRIEQELQEIKALLQARPGRGETPAATMPPPMVSLNVHGEPFRGSALAKVAILEYSDFDCTYCARYAKEIYPLIDHAYIQAGKVKYFFRDLPNPEHLNAMFKARLARCAGEQGRFWEAHDRLFQDQKPFDAPGMATFIQAVGLDAAPFQACIASDRYTEAIERSAGLANSLRINGTPAFLIGILSDDGSVIRASKIFLGAESFDAFRKVLDDLLAPAGKPPAS